jgi:hypothetical protein
LNLVRIFFWFGSSSFWNFDRVHNEDQSHLNSLALTISNRSKT